MVESFESMSDCHDLVAVAEDRIDVEMLVEELAQATGVSLNGATRSFVEEIALGAVARSL
jgi:hypothetical protein